MNDQLRATVEQLIIEYKRRIELEEQTIAALESGELRSHSGAEDTTQASITFHRQGVDAFRRGLEVLKEVGASSFS